MKAERDVPMAVLIKSSEDIARMRVAGRLAGEVLDHVSAHVRPGVTTGELNDLCHAYMVETQGSTPAPLLLILGIVLLLLAGALVARERNAIAGAR